MWNIERIVQFWHYFENINNIALMDGVSVMLFDLKDSVGINVY